MWPNLTPYKIIQRVSYGVSNSGSTDTNFGWVIYKNRKKGRYRVKGCRREVKDSNKGFT